MKKLQKLKLNFLSKSELEKRQLLSIKGGDSCSCSCTMDTMNQTTGSPSSFSHHCDGSCACVCGGEDAQGNTDNRWISSLSGY